MISNNKTDISWFPNILVHPYWQCKCWVCKHPKHQFSFSIAAYKMPEAICRGDQTLSVSHSHAVYLTQREVKKGEESSHSADKPLLNLPSCSFKKHTHTLSGRQRWAALCIRTAARQDVIRLQNSQLAILLTVYTAYCARRCWKN